MAATAHVDPPKPPSRAESLQKMLDLEKQFKDTHTPPAADMTPPAQPSPRPVPIHVRRRATRKSMFQQQKQQKQQNKGGSADPVSLSITIPSPVRSETAHKPPAASRSPTVHTPADHEAGMPPLEDNTNHDEGGSDSKHPERENANSDDANADGDGDGDGDDRSLSGHSSICQSPSWEGYGQKKKDKKKKQAAEQRKKNKEKDKLHEEQELYAAAKKKTTNRLQKMPATSAGKKVRSKHGSTQGGADAPPPPGATDKVSYPPPSSRSHALRSSLPVFHKRHNSASTASSSLSSKAAAAEPLAGLAAAPNRPGDSSRSQGPRLYLTSSLSDQALSAPSTLDRRGRPGSVAAAAATAVATADSATSSSYVRRTRAQSIERSIRGFIQEAALSDPGLQNKTALRTPPSYPSPVQQRPATSGSRPVSSRSAKTMDSDKGPSKTRPQHQQPAEGDSGTIHSSSSSSTADYAAFLAKPYTPPNLSLTAPAGSLFSSIKSRISRRSSISSGTVTTTSPTASAEAKSAPSAPSAPSATTAPTAQTASTAPTAPTASVSAPAGRSFKERAMGAMHLQSASGAAAASSSAPARASAGSAPAPRKGAGQLQIPRTEAKTRRLPKKTRVFGLASKETLTRENGNIGGSVSGSGSGSGSGGGGGGVLPTRGRLSEGSSASSYHDDSSFPPSPASTPGTSRPQSAKGLSAAIEEIRVRSPSMFLSSQEDLTPARPHTQGTTAEDGVDRQAPPDALADGLGILGGAWSPAAPAPASAPAPGTDTQSSVTTLTDQTSAVSLVLPADSCKDKRVRQNVPERHVAGGGKDEPSQQVQHLVPPPKSQARYRDSAALPKPLLVAPAPAKETAVLCLAPPSAGQAVPQLQAARRSTPLVSSPLSHVVPPSSSSASASAASSASSVSPREGELATTRGAGMAAKPLAKMLVECCHCKFFHDMPSRVYECMAQPDAVVTDRDLGVSGAITTMVKCPWCAHNMGTQCCAGYAAVVYLKERLH